MKRLLSIILAMAMILTLIPAVSANEETGADGITINYSFLKADYDSSLASQKDITYANSGGRICFDEANTTATGGTVASWGSISSGVYKFPYFNCSADGKYITFRINVPKTGAYTATLDYWVSKNTSAVADIYLIPCKGNENFTSALSSATPVFDDISFNKTEEQANNTIVNADETFTATTAGEYYLVIKRVSTAGACRIRGFSLSQGTPNVPTIIYAGVEFSKNTIDAGVAEEAEISISAAYMSDGSLAEESAFSNVTYQSSDESVAVVENGKVKAVCHGTATISAMLGDYVLGGADITVTNSKASGVTIGYSFASADYSASLVPEDITYANSNGRFELGEETSTNATLSGWSYGAAFLNMGNGQFVSYKIRVPEAGVYKAKLDYVRRTSGATADIYILPGDVEDIGDAIENEKPLFEEVNFKADADMADSRSRILDIKTAGEYYLVFTKTGGDSAARPKYLTLDGNGEKTVLIYADISLGETALKVGDTTELTQGKVYLSDGTETNATGVTYKSTNEKAATVSGTTVTAVGGGSAKIQAVRSDGYVLDEETITVEAPEPEIILPEEKEITDTTVNFMASAYEGGSVSDARVQEVTIGDNVTVTATAEEGYNFAYWKNSAGVVLSENETETFKVNTNTAVIAVFDKAPEDSAIPVYFYNGNGEALGSETAEKGKTFGEVEKPDANLTGYVFDKWSISDDAVINSIVRAVALFKDSDKPFTVKAGSEIVASGVKYGESVTVNGSENFSCWKLGDKVMSYEKDYTFNVYGDITLTEVTGETMEKAPVLVLDKVGDSYFLTYDAGEYELVEAGILFGSEGVSIESIDGYKASAKRGTGQFTAMPHAGATESTTARGYMVCKDGNSYKVIYAD